MICDRSGRGGCDVGRNDRKAGRTRCRATRGKAPGEAWEGVGRGPAENAGRRLRRRRAMAFPARLTRCLRRRRARRLRRCRGNHCGETPADASVKTSGDGLAKMSGETPAEAPGGLPRGGPADASVKIGDFGGRKPIMGVRGLYELREHHGAGYRVFFSIIDDRIVLLLAGSSKQNQQRKIDQAASNLADHNERRV